MFVRGGSLFDVLHFKKVCKYVPKILTYIYELFCLPRTVKNGEPKFPLKTNISCRQSQLIDNYLYRITKVINLFHGIKLTQREPNTRLSFLI